MSGSGVDSAPERIQGVLLDDPASLRKAFHLRKKAFVLTTIPPKRKSEYEDKGWVVVKTNPKSGSLRMRKQKDADEVFEDRVWRLFYGLGFAILNRDRRCFVVPSSGVRHQIDVLARDDTNVFLIECKHSGASEAVSAMTALRKFASDAQPIRKALEAQWGSHFGRLNFVVAVSTEKRDPEVRYVDDKRKLGVNLYLWSGFDIESLESLTASTGHIAKTQLYTAIFEDKKQRSLAKEYSALKAKVGGQTCYSFLIPAKDLLKYAHVHRRTHVEVGTAASTYQRMLRPGKLRTIMAFVDDEGYFPNTVIVNFSHKRRPQFRSKESLGNVELGRLELPPYYGSAWVIDGQHRLYGAASAARDLLLPVFAFENMPEIYQANLFIEINKEQTPVEGDLLWDLYSDIYQDSEDSRQRKYYLIAETAKRLHERGPYASHITIPSRPATKEPKIKLTTVCSTLESYSPWSDLQHPNAQSATPAYAARILNAYFEAVQELWPEGWTPELKGKSVLLSNNGFGVFTMVFHDIVRYMVYKKEEALLRPPNTARFKEELKRRYLTPVVEWLKDDKGTRHAIITQTGRGKQSENAAYIDMKIGEHVKDFSPPRVPQGTLEPPPAQPHAVETLQTRANTAEGVLREHILHRLKEHYGDGAWWKRGIPDSLKKAADSKWLDDVKRNPFLARDRTNQNARKFEYFCLGELKDIMLYGDNWTAVFEPAFGTKENVTRRVKDITVLRNPLDHRRAFDKQDLCDGMAGLLWLSRVLAKPDINPYFS